MDTASTSTQEYAVILDGGNNVTIQGNFISGAKNAGIYIAVTDRTLVTGNNFGLSPGIPAVQYGTGRLISNQEYGNQLNGVPQGSFIDVPPGGSIQAAIDVLPSTGGEVRLFPNTTYVITTGIVSAKDNVHISAPGWGTVIQRGASMGGSTQQERTVLQLSGMGCLVEGMTFDGNGFANITGYAEILVSGTHSRVTGVQVINCAGEINIGVSGSDSRVDHCTIVGFGILSTLRCYGIWGIPGSHNRLQIDNNVVTNTNNDGIGASGSGATISGNTVSGCHCYLLSGGGQIQIYGNTDADASVIVSGNHIGQGGGAAASGLILFGNNITATGNTIINQYGVGIGLEDGNGFTITGNTVLNTGLDMSGTQDGIAIGGVNDFVISGNTIGDNQLTPTMRWAINVTSGVSGRYTIVGNECGPCTDSSVIHDGGTGTAKVVANNGGVDGGFSMVNVLDYGAVGDGITDDTAAIQAVFNTYAGNAIVYLPWSGNHYKISTWLTIPDNSDILLTGVISALPGLTTGRLIFVSGVSNVVFRGTGVLDGSNVAPWTWEQINSANIHISDITLQNANLGNLNIGSSNKVIVDGITCQGAGGAANGFAIGCTDCWLTNSKIDGANNGDYGFAFYGGVTNCGAIGNVVKNCGAGTAFSPPGIGILSDGDPSSPQGQPCKDIIIANNISHDNNAGGISVLNEAGGVQSGIIISNNRCYNNCKQPVDAGSVADCFVDHVTGLTISGNQFSNSGTSSIMVAGIYIGASVNHVQITLNQIWNVGQGRSDGAGLWIDGTDNVYANGNWVYDDQGTPTMSSSIIGSAGTHNTYIGNRFDVGFDLALNTDTFSANAIGSSYLFGAHTRLNMIASQGALNVAGTPRWYFGNSQNDEMGGNSGSDFQIVGVDDAGTGLISPAAIIIKRSTGEVALQKLNMANIATSSSGLVAGDVWRNGTVLNIV
jgi:parallel beta-helix repeat protein